MTISVAKMPDLGLFGASKWLVFPFSGPLGALRVPQRVKKRVSDTDLVNIGQLDHYVVFGTKFGPVQDFQRGKKGRIGVQQTPLDPP